MSKEEIEIIKFLSIFNKSEIDYCKLEKVDVKAILNLIEKQQEELNKEKERREIAEENHKLLSLDIGQACKDLGLPEDTIIADELVLEINKNYIHKDKIIEILGIDEDISEEKLLSLLETLMSEVDRLEDIEDRKVQIEYNNVFNKGVKSVEDKIRERVKEIKDRKVEDMFITASQGKLDTIIELEKLLGDKNE